MFCPRVLDFADRRRVAISEAVKGAPAIDSPLRVCDALSMPLPTLAATAIDGYLDAADAAVPGLIEGLYVTGSIALDDYQPQISDVDLVAVCSETPSGPQLAALAALHRSSRPSVDVLYITRSDLKRDPGSLSPPHSVLGMFRTEGGFEANPVVWRILATRAVPVRGPKLVDEDVWFDADAFRRWNLNNLDDYWAARIEEWQRLEPTETRVRHEYGLQWLVLGIPRLHHTIATLDVTSKTGAGRYALEITDERWHPVIEAAIALRNDQGALLPSSPDVMRQDAVELGAWLIEDAHRLTT
jgi:hypothetical protein